MAKPRPARQEEILLIPFLDILCSLIGVMVLIIVVLCAAQMQRVKGRTKEDVALAEKLQALRNRKIAEEKSAVDRQRQIADLERRAQAVSERERQLAQLRQRQQDLKREIAEARAASQVKKPVEDPRVALRQQIAALEAQLAAIDAQEASLAQESAQLRIELAKRKDPAKQQPGFSVVRSTGSGGLADQRLVVVEADGGELILPGDGGPAVRIPRDAIGQDPRLDAFLGKIKGDARSSLLVLVRPDGWLAFVRTAGWAEQRFGISASKLPIPGDGPIDLKALQAP